MAWAPRITGQLALSGATLVNTAGPALAAEAAQIDGDLLLDQDVVAAGRARPGRCRSPAPWSARC